MSLASLTLAVGQILEEASVCYLVSHSLMSDSTVFPTLSAQLTAALLDIAWPVLSMVGNASVATPWLEAPAWMSRSATCLVKAMPRRPVEED